MGLPWRPRGRDRDGVDCWGLARLVLAEQAGLDLPAWDTVAPGDALAASRRIRVETRSGGWVPVPPAAAMPLDVAVMRGVPLHIGIVAPGRRILHVLEGCSAVLQPIAALTHRIEGFYRVAV